MENLTQLITVFSPIITFVGAFITVFVTLRNSTATRRAALISSFVNNRMEHIKELRTNLYDFTSEYLQNSNKHTTKLMLIKSRVELSVFGNKQIYEQLLQDMQNCIDNEYNAEYYYKLISEIQLLANRIWEITKDETGSKMKSDGLLHKTTKVVTATVGGAGGFVANNTYKRIIKEKDDIENENEKQVYNQMKNSIESDSD